tara:strand:+ start:13176 stop:15641 length:2466 start_codon:yes stop_codon:yes gene_type:complete
MAPEKIGPYRILKPIGAGAMGEVFLGEDETLGRQVAIKTLPEEFSRDVTRRQRFMQEAQSASAINHPNACVIYGVGETENGDAYIAMEYVEGNTLKELLVNGPLVLDLTVEFSTQIADALDEAHKVGVVHRDIKSANVIVNQRGQAKVLDFGLAKKLDEENDIDATRMVETRDGQIVGSPGYMSPEQATGKDVDGRTDIFSLGVVMYEMITGQLPFVGESLGDTIQKICQQSPPAMARFNYELPQELERITLKCLQKDTSRRYQSASELVVDLRNFGSTMHGEGRETTGIDVTQTSIQARPNLEIESRSSEPSAEEIQACDILISCSELDNQAFSPGGEGWISRFHRNLKIRVEQLTGDRLKVGFCEMPAGDSGVSEALLDTVTTAKSMVTVVSPPFTKSKACIDGTEKYWSSIVDESNAGMSLKSIYKVVKTPVHEEDVDTELDTIFRQLLAYEFYDRDTETNRVREFDESHGDEAAQRYYERIYDLAYEISDQVKRAKDYDHLDSGSFSKIRKSIYLAETTADLKEERERLRREFLEQGHIVYPDRSLPTEAAELSSAVEEFMSKCDLIIQPVGARYGFVPEGGEESVLMIQNRIARNITAAKAKPRYVWMARDLVVDDGRQKQFVEMLREEPATCKGVELVRDSIENLKELLEQRWQAELESLKQVKTVTEESVIVDVARVYLIYEKRDEQAVEPLEDHLFDQGFDVMVPEFEGTEHEITEIHINNLSDCDAVLIYYGQSGKAWVDIKVRELTKALGYRDGKPIERAAVFVGPPEDRRKDRFKTHAVEVIRSEGEQLQLERLDSFCVDVKNIKQGQGE